jgi:hypothetical protein
VSVVGVELRVDRASAIVRLRGGRVGAHAEVAFDPSSPEGAVVALREALGRVRSVHLAIGLAHLDVAPVTVPKVARETARAILATNADRFFLGTSAAAVGIERSMTLGFAASAADVQRWVDAFERWAPVTVVEAMPESLLRGLAAHEIRDAHLLIAAGAGDHGVIDVRDGALTRVRRVPLLRGPSELNGAQPLAAQMARAIPPDVFVAWGASAADPSDQSAMLLSQDMQRSWSARRWWRGAQLAALALLGVAAMATSAGRWRARTLTALEARVQALAPQAGEPLRLRATLAAAAQERAVLAASPVVDAINVLSTLSRQLPPDAVLQRLQFDGESWQLIGTTRNTESVVRRLSSDSLFANVRLAGPTTRFRDGGAMVESFTLAFTTRRPSAAP